MKPNPKLSDDERAIMFDKQTEPAWSGTLLHETRHGGYVCKNCGTKLFDSDAKFDSGSGWPSFVEPANRQHVTLTEDRSFGTIRTEVSCATCGAHLGHVFDDGPSDRGGQRFCINSASLVFDEQENSVDT